MRPQRILLIDDHPLFRQGVAHLLDGEPDLVTVGEAATGRAGIAQSAALRPDIAICDLHLPDMDGHEVVRALRRQEQPPAVIALTMYEDEEQFLLTMHAGAAAYALKVLAGRELVALVRRVVRGEEFPDEPIGARVFGAARGGERLADPARPGAAVAGIGALLTAREIEVLGYLVRGESNRAIAGYLAIREQTVEKHVSAILSKLAVADRTQAVVCALRRGWVRLDLER